MFYTPLKHQVPDWWRSFVLWVNERVLEVIWFFRTMGTFDFVWLICSLWLLVMSFWMRQFNRPVQIGYWIVVLVFIVGYPLLKGFT